jgi:uncharacterized protein YdeI (YjbR/CyaY-like superfamily)
MEDPQQILNQEADTAGSIGRITSVQDLPADEILIQYIRHAVSLNAEGVKAAPRVKKTESSAEIVIPEYFTTLLDQHPLAKTQFEKFSPSQKKEYNPGLKKQKPMPPDQNGC